jgi:acetylornithine/succinyldiaminopimelate/putrescine aminotransferase
MPIGAFISSKEIMQSLTHDPVLGHITTFGGHPVSCAAALANMKVLQAEYDHLIGTVKDKESLFLSLLKHPDIKIIRSAGLLMAVELDSFDRVLAVIKKCIEQGLVTDWFLFNANALRIAPPLIISEAEIRAACQIILTALEETTS